MLRDAEENEHLYEIVPEAEVEPYELLLEDLRSLGGDKIALLIFVFVVRVQFLNDAQGGRGWLIFLRRPMA